MENLLTTTEVQERLKLDRTTVYRMLKDGRLRGVKVGQQWRFPLSSVDAILATSKAPASTLPATCDLPIHCVQTIQDLFAELSGFAAQIFDPAGAPLTALSGDPHAGRALRLLAHQPLQPGWRFSNEGTTGLVAPIQVNGLVSAWLIAGPVDQTQQAHLKRAIEQVIRAIESVGRERARVQARLQRIAELSTLEEPEVAGAF